MSEQCQFVVPAMDIDPAVRAELAAYLRAGLVLETVAVHSIGAESEQVVGGQISSAPPPP